jgi:hypothetical protein
MEWLSGSSQVELRLPGPALSDGPREIDERKVMYKTRVLPAPASMFSSFMSNYPLPLPYYRVPLAVQEIPFAARPLPFDIKRQYNRDRLKQVVSTEFSEDEEMALVFVYVEFCDKSCDEWELPKRVDFQPYLEWHGWKLSYRGVIAD